MVHIVNVTGAVWKIFGKFYGEKENNVKAKRGGKKKVEFKARRYLNLNGALLLLMVFYLSGGFT